MEEKASISTTRKEPAPGMELCFLYWGGCGPIAVTLTEYTAKYLEAAYVKVWLGDSSWAA